MKLYTKTGDGGKTSLKGGRVAKDDAHVEAYGTVDELNSFVGVAAALASELEPAHSLAAELVEIQQELFDCGSDLAFAMPADPHYKVTSEMTDRLERWIDAHTDAAPPIERFILPGGSRLSATLHVCRTVCRRAERRIVTLAAAEPVPANVLKYINRLSDYFFAAARSANSALGVPDTEYARSANVFKTRKDS